ncbi:sphingosine kinase 2-like isoform X2 [Dermacentor albipictus]|uniref:sphingosine kinase 2-like isoform X2 n=1 Tax=Dermacentor albipictus TaxID=60249 RepID=UPI0031FDEB00
MQCVLKDTFRLYPNAEDDYDVTLFDKSLVFEPCVKGKGLPQYRSRTEVKLDDVIGCHVMRVAENATGLKKTVSYFCVYAYHLIQKKKNLGHRRQKRTYVFTVDKSDEYEANLAISRVWQSAFLWLLRGVKPERGGGFPNLQPEPEGGSTGPTWLRNDVFSASVRRQDESDDGVFRPLALDSLPKGPRVHRESRRALNVEDWYTSSVADTATTAVTLVTVPVLNGSSTESRQSQAEDPSTSPESPESGPFRVDHLLELPSERTAVTTDLPIATDSPAIGRSAASDGQAFIPAELPAQRHYLVIVNPKSGPGRSLEIFLHRVRPILAEADISHLLLVTERRNHARDFIKNLHLNQWSGIIIISGDGLLYEVYNGLMERPDWELAIKIPIGMIPGGSGNGLARTISHAANEPYVSDPILASTLGIAKGRVAPLDLMKVETPSGPLYSFLNVGWGIMADIDIESEKLRAIGEIRFTLWAFWRVFNLRTYHGRISYLPATEKMKGGNGVISRLVTSSSARNGPSLSPLPRNQSSGTDLGELCGQNGSARTFHRSDSAPEGHRMGDCGTSQDEGNESGLERATEHAVQGGTEDHVTPLTGEELPPELELVADSSVERVPGPKPQEPALSAPEWFPALTDPVPDDWTVEEGRFIICYSSTVSHLGTNLFIAPESRLDDGIAWLLIIRGEVTRFQVLSYFKAQEAGQHVDLPFVRLIPVRAFRLETFSDCTITVDGEVVKTRILQARVLPSLGRILTF